ncbi:hypothetical protein [Kitasatospora viridis]|uniref:Uncharacterized protein n=1 Tax=Kitasatospora viridis TaxID=281105 RepID=A0A561ULQ6_9ACTN|nr:hypothetical protein [Kitasatospora viridis]TWG00280.1 hypothetical protein FHX73_114154 [Kitasatospora viridis]
MSENLNETSDHGADEATAEDNGRGRHRGVLASEETAEAGNPHGRHRLDAAAN